MPLEPTYPAYSPFMLRNELVLDPQNLGYSGYLATGDYSSLTNLLNKVGSGTAYDIWRNDIQPAEVVNNINSVDFAKMTVTQLQQMQLLFLAAPIDASSSGTRQNFLVIFSGMSGTLLNISGVDNELGSRVEVLFGDGVNVSEGQVRYAWGISSGLSG